ncbi:MAG: amidohydrolase [Opitutae bacterium]|nr:amidohydrolase [Opitutae bacterium]
MKVIDAHVHLYPPEVGRDPTAWAAARREPHWATLCARRRRDGLPVQLFPTVDELLRDMDAAGVEQSVLLGWYWENPATCVWQNRFYAECVRAHPDRLAAFATVHPAAGPAALDEIRRARGDGLIGLGELSPHSQGVPLDDPSWLAILHLAGELKLPVNLHVTDPQSRRYPGWVETPLCDFVSLAKEFPATTFILAHWGGGLAFDAEDRALQNVYYDTAASPLLYDDEVWSRAVGTIGAGRILFGSDNPLRLYPKTDAGTGMAAFVRELHHAISGEAREEIGAGNARRLLRL